MNQKAINNYPSSDRDLSAPPYILDNQLQSIANAITLNRDAVSSAGLFNGKMGACLFYYKYGSYSKKKHYSDLASGLLDEVFEAIDADTPLNFDTGLAGIAWAIEYLVDNKFVEADTNEILGDLDEAIFEHYKLLGPDRYQEILNIVPYIISRLKNKEISVHELQHQNLLTLAQNTYKNIHEVLTHTPVNLQSTEINLILLFIKETQKLQLFKAEYGQFYNTYFTKLFNSFNGSNYPFSVYLFLKLVYTFDGSAISKEAPEGLLNHWRHYLKGFEHDALFNEKFMMANLNTLITAYLFRPSIAAVNEIDADFFKQGVKRLEEAAYWDNQLQNLPLLKADLNGLAGLGLSTLFLAELADGSV